MPLTESRKRANKKYLAKTYVRLTCNIKKEDAEIFKELCATAGTTPNAVFRAAVDDFVREHAKKTE